jgi:hypothetical protein
MKTEKEKEKNPVAYCSYESRFVHLGPWESFYSGVKPLAAFERRRRTGRLDYRPVDARRRRGRDARESPCPGAPVGGHGLPRNGPRRRVRVSSGTSGSGHGGAAMDRPRQRGSDQSKEPITTTASRRARNHRRSNGLLTGVSWPRRGEPRRRV